MSSCWGVILFSSLFVYSVFFFFALLHDVRIQSFRLWQFNFNYGEIPHNTQQLANGAKKNKQHKIIFRIGRFYCISDSIACIFWRYRLVLIEPVFVNFDCCYFQIIACFYGNFSLLCNLRY